jgi:MFS family permease
MNRIRACLYLSVFVIMGLSDAVVPILPDLSDETFVQSMIFSAYFAGALVSMIPFGMLADRYGNTQFILLSIVLTITSGFLIFLSTSSHVLVSARFVEGCACGAFFPAAFSMLAKFENRRQCIGEFIFLINIGLALGVVVAAELTHYHLKCGILTFVLLAIPALVLAISLKQDSGDPDIPPASQRISGIFAILSDARYLQIWVIAFVLFGATGVIVAYFPSFTDLTPPPMGLALSGVYFGAMVTSLIGSRARTTERWLVRAGALITGIGIVVTLCHPIGLTIMGAGSGFVMVGLVAGVASLGSDHGMAMGVFNTCNYAGFAALPVFAAGILWYVDYAALFGIAGIAVGALALFPLHALAVKR